MRNSSLLRSLKEKQINPLPTKEESFISFYIFSLSPLHICSIIGKYLPLNSVLIVSIYLKIQYRRRGTVGCPSKWPGWKKIYVGTIYIYSTYVCMNTLFIGA